ncbi:potassium/sodium hyperpolarization-activated cyclic nucleotide-gated channel 3-like [Anthonomus grandis grandis]|uniref:potassium/sodium hyperpolarization-activated cyclic nucleotide-gated channel 3-like n=1 Tax=Anthonomus grandis grandis TaxID=2921223 RepID=UPI002165C123|nr:potassium/sodium hyperpolarization-activated cyclic nucleotide-gated channel 3-like [Anthonomus grandis grandis]
MSKTGYAEEPLQLKKVKIVNNHEKEPPRKENVSLREKLWNFVTVSGKNPDTIKFFNSELKIEAEKQRHWDNFRYAIHPLNVNQEFYRIEIVEEQLFNLIKYVTGKALVISVWMVTLAIFMSTMTLDIKFEEIITELKEYMVSKQLPEELKIRMVSYYKFKYHKAYVNEKYIRSIFSTNLKREMDVFLYKSLINQVSIFSHISPKNMQLITANLVPEIYLPSDLIIQSGTHGDCMYFIESGTVAVFTPSGKEICHLHDGDYFGEVSLLSVSKKRTASVVAIEATRIYKLRNKVFHTCFKKTEQAYQLIREMAKKRILQTDDLERLFKKDKLEQQYLENFRE